jgi:uncharacterized RDD family membrane protein YckC
MTDTIERGVFYAVPDYAGIGRRVLILFIDGVVLMILLLAITIPAMILNVSQVPYFCAGILVTMIYLALLPATGIGTIGYICMGVALVDLHGHRVPFWRALFRAGFIVLGPFNLLADVIWLGGDANRQSIRDKIARTYVVRRDAFPAGSGEIRYRTYFIFGYNIVFAEVERQSRPPAAPPVLDALTRS